VRPVPRGRSEIPDLRVPLVPRERKGLLVSRDRRDRQVLRVLPGQPVPRVLPESLEQLVRKEQPDLKEPPDLRVRLDPSEARKETLARPVRKDLPASPGRPAPTVRLVLREQPVLTVLLVQPAHRVQLVPLEALKATRVRLVRQDLKGI
jgi:hypothetical protein